MIACRKCACIHGTVLNGECDHRETGEDCVVFPVPDPSVSHVFVVRFVERKSGQFFLAVRTRVTSALTVRNYVIGCYFPGGVQTYSTRRGVMFTWANLTRSQWESRVRSVWED